MWHNNLLFYSSKWHQFKCYCGFTPFDITILNCPQRFIHETYSLAYRKFWNFHWNRTLKSKITESFWTDLFVVSFVNNQGKLYMVFSIRLQTIRTIPAYSIYDDLRFCARLLWKINHQFPILGPLDSNYCFWQSVDVSNFSLNKPKSWRNK